MEIHANAALSLKGRRQLVVRVVDQGWSLSGAAAASEVSERTARKWVRRYRDEGDTGLLDRSSAPTTQPRARSRQGAVDEVASALPPFTTAKEKRGSERAACHARGGEGRHVGAASSAVPAVPTGRTFSAVSSKSGTRRERRAPNS